MVSASSVSASVGLASLGNNESVFSSKPSLVELRRKARTTNGPRTKIRANHDFLTQGSVAQIYRHREADRAPGLLSCTAHCPRQPP